MRVYRTNQVAALTIVAGGAIAALLTLSPLVWQSPADEVSAPDPVDTPSMTSEARPDAVDRAERILRDRIDEFGVEEPLVQQARGFDLQQNYPNPFNPETRIPFDLLEGLFSDGGTAVVSVRIYNVLQEFVAAPVALSHASGEGAELVQLEYTQPGTYEAFWDGTDQSGRQVASGLYFVQLNVNGRSKVRRLYRARREAVAESATRVVFTEYNLAMGIRRTESVRDFLSDFGISADLFAVTLVGRGAASGQPE